MSTSKRNQTTTGWAISSQPLSLHESSYLLNKSTALAQWCQKYEYLQKMQGHLAKEVKYGSASEAPTQCAAMRYIGIFDIFYLPAITCDRRTRNNTLITFQSCKVLTHSVKKDLFSLVQCSWKAFKTHESNTWAACVVSLTCTESNTHTLMAPCVFATQCCFWSVWLSVFISVGYSLLTQSQSTLHIVTNH